MADAFTSPTPAETPDTSMPPVEAPATSPVTEQPVVATPAITSAPAVAPVTSPLAAPVVSPGAAPVVAATTPTGQPIHVSVNLGGAAGPNGEFPEELRRWNWGAFFLTWVWGVAHNTYLAFLVLIPFLNIYIVISLGIKGNELAWKNRRFESIEQFKAVQKRWAQWGLGFFIISTIGFILLPILAFSSLAGPGGKSNGGSDQTRKNNIDQIAKDLNAYGADSTSGGILPYSLSGLGKTEPTDPFTGYDYDYTVSDSGAKAEVCATLSDDTKYCKSATVTDTTPSE